MKRGAQRTMKKPKLRFGKLAGRARQIVTGLTNAIAFQKPDCCSVDDFAEQFKTTPGRLRQTLGRLQEAGLITVKGEILPQVVPTVKLLQSQDPELNKAQASKLIRQYERGYK
jgi:hypothetical protein